ncbi:MAG TPA: Dabb family protein [Gemmataceae bacterium]|nr:Dabb family protein [Gemmataceae bacterium]
MIRKTVLAAALLGLGAGAGLPDPARPALNPENPAVGKTAPFVHCVIFHLKKDAPAGEADQLIADAHELLRPIPSVRDLRAGKPAVKEKPDNAKTDYQVGLLVLFDDVEGLNTYLNHPRHLQYVERHGKHIDMTKLGVYDFVDQKK